MLSAGLTVTIGVFGLFHPAEVWVHAAGSEPLKIESGVSSMTLEGNRISKFRLGHTTLSRVTTTSGGPVDFVLIVPGKIERQYRGVLTLQPGKGELIATVDMDLELAVASVVAAESAPGAAIEALKSQAVVARSFYLACHRRHAAFDFCDTTHCQFIRHSPGPDTHAFRAAEATRGLVLTYRGHVLPALYSAACGGHTRSLHTIQPPGDYPYFAVECDYCLRHPRNAVRGHRLGLCQQGAAEMAARGSGFRAVLNHYYPATAVADASAAFASE